jgi:hypothetical protein
MEEYGLPEEDPCALIKYYEEAMDIAISAYQPPK